MEGWQIVFVIFVRSRSDFVADFARSAEEIRLHGE